jgi:oxygen-independent coproporphyrinogen-3 oxidase
MQHATASDSDSPAAASSLSPAADPDYGALYLHIPFCARRCAYCDFITEAIAASDPRLDEATESLIREIRAASREGLLGGIRTVYIGGGTPTFLGHGRLVSLVYALALSLNLLPETEFTVEANPESLTSALVRDLYSLGVNRLSLGVQSFCDRELAALGRIHNAETARHAVKLARERMENVSLDLMCGIPLQTSASWRKTLHEAIACDPAHISVYPLAVEENTPFAQAVESGRMRIADEDEQAARMQTAAAMLQEAGFERYEVASYARPGFACRHNRAYWTGVPYLGLGPGAASMRPSEQGRVRSLDGNPLERLSFAEAALEDVMLGMRLSEGVSRQLVERATSYTPSLRDTFAGLLGAGLIREEQGRYQPTDRGWLLGNELYGRIWNTPR